MKDPVTRKKVVFVSPTDTKQYSEMIKTIPQDRLPPEMKGVGSWLSIDQAWDILLNNGCPSDSFKL